MIEFEVDLQGVKNIEKALLFIKNNLTDFTIPLKESGAYMLRSVDKNFRQEGRPNKWPKLSPLTLSMRRNTKSKSVKILQDTGRLKQSITTNSAMRLKNKGTLAIGTSVPYARIHQQGGTQRLFNTNKMVKIPKRPYLLFQNEDKKAINKIFSNYVMTIIKRFK